MSMEQQPMQPQEGGCAEAASAVPAAGQGPDAALGPQVQGSAPQPQAQPASGGAYQTAPAPGPYVQAAPQQPAQQPPAAPQGVMQGPSQAFAAPAPGTGQMYAGQVPGQQPMYASPVQGQQPMYASPVFGQQPMYTGVVPGQQPAYPGPVPGYGVPSSHDGEDDCGSGDDHAGASGPKTAEQLKHDMNKYGQLYGMINEAAEGNPDVSKFLNFFQTSGADFWKGALVGAGLTLLLTNDVVKGAIAGGAANVFGWFSKSAEEKEAEEDRKAEARFAKEG